MRTFLKFLCSRTFFINLGIASVLSVLLVFLSLGLLRVFTRHGTSIEVPDLSRMSSKEMERTLKGAGLRYRILDSAVYVPDCPGRSIIDQSPAAGEKVKAGRKIYLSINRSGYKKVAIPKIIQVTRRNAASMLRAVGLEVGGVTYEYGIGKDMVYRIRYKGEYVSPGDRLPKTSEIELVCGNGKVPESSVTSGPGRKGTSNGP